MKSQYKMKMSKIKSEQETFQYRTLVGYLNKLAAMERAYERNPNHPTIDQVRINGAVRRFHNWRDNICSQNVRDIFTHHHS
jgi:hypothetical protein